MCSDLEGEKRRRIIACSPLRAVPVAQPVMLSPWHRGVRRTLQTVRWLVWDLSGLRYIWETILPRRPHTRLRRPPSTFVVLSATFAITLYQIGSARHESALNRLQAQVLSTEGQLTGPGEHASRLYTAGIVQRMEIPAQPSFTKPWSLLGVPQPREDVVLRMKQLLADACRGFSEVTESRAVLEQVDLSQVDLTGVYLVGANLRMANLSGADLIRAKLIGADLVGANLSGVNLSYADLPYAYLYGANLSGANLTSANLSYVTWTDGRVCAKATNLTRSPETGPSLMNGP